MTEKPVQNKNIYVVLAVFIFAFAVAFAGMSLVFDRLLFAIGPAIVIGIGVALAVYIYLNRKNQHL